MLGERLMPELAKLLDGPAVSYGKGRSSVSLVKWSTAVLAFIQCSASRCGQRSAGEKP
jgi:hypothetical protein